MAKAVNKRNKKKQDEELLEVNTDVDTEEEELDIEDEETEVDVEAQAKALAEEEAEDVDVENAIDDFQQVKVVITKEVPRFLVGTEWHEPLEVGQKVKLAKHIAEHLQERGRAEIV